MCVCPRVPDRNPELYPCDTAGSHIARSSNHKVRKVQCVFGLMGSFSSIGHAIHCDHR